MCVCVSTRYFTSLCDGLGGIGQATYINKLAGRLGNRRTFELGALISAVSYLAQGLCMVLPSPYNILRLSNIDFF